MSLPETAAEPLRRAGALQRSGRPEEAAAIYRALLRRHPRVPQLHNNLAAALNAAGRVREAVASYRRAIRLRPDYAIAHRNLAGLLARDGRTDAALAHADKAHRFAGGDPATLSALAGLLAPMRFARPAPAARRLLLALFERRDADHQALAAAGLSLVLAEPAARAASMAALAHELHGGAAGPLLSDLPVDGLLLRLLCQTVLASPELECWITLTRRALLTRLLAGEPVTAAPALLAAIALQCRQTEYSYQQSAAERQDAAALGAGLSAIASASADWLVPAMYREPAPRWFAAGWLAGASRPDRDPVALLLARAVAEPREEAALAAAIPSFGTIREATSRRVRAQYEANPYPRWQSADLLQPPRPLPALLAARFPAFRPAVPGLAAPQVLIAGCGTGRQAVITARRYRGARVTAIDLSRRSLAHGARMAAALAVANLSFLHGDLLDVQALGRRFDLIECSGVLHHMAEPLAGWRALRAVLAPGGVMRIALYSRHARAGFAELRESVDGLAGEALAARIRAARRRLLRAGDAGPARLLLQTADAYSMSGYRDLLMHTSEQGFTLPEIAAALRALDLRFLGFDWLADAALARYRARFPQDRDGAAPAAWDSAWDAVERDHPESFITMYQFWCQAM